MEINKKESEVIEFKKSTSELKEAIISIVSILNKHKNGEIYFGIKNNGEIVGQSVTERTIREISKSISDHIEPKIFPEVKEIELYNKKCVHVIFTGNDSPYYAYGRAYIRVGDEDKKLSSKELEKIILDKNKDKLSWDREVCKEAELKDISSAKLKKFLKDSNLGYDSIENSLKKLGLISGKSLLNSAVILFSKNPEKFFRNAKLRCAVFGTEDTAVPIDMQEFEGDLFYLITEALNYILKNIHIGMEVEGLYREDIPEIDKMAIREAIINAFCHRNYYLYDSVNIAIFKDRLEIRSPGLLYGGLTIEKIKSQEVSERRNELLAEMFHKVHLVEKWGRGIRLILSKEPSTEFKEIGRQFVVVFKRKHLEVTDRVGEKDTERDTEKDTEKLLSKEEKNILKLFRDNPKITSEELSKLLEINLRNTKKRISKLKEKGLINRIGPDKGGHWEITKKGDK